MGLALHSQPSDSIFMHRHLPPEPPRASRRHRGRDSPSNNNALLRTVLEQRGAVPKNALIRVHDVRQGRSSGGNRRSPTVHHFHRGSALDSDDDALRLARSTVSLPCDRARDRVPSLERQNAFRVQSTSKPPPHRSLSQGCEAEDPEVAELYRLGLLYDDEHVRGSGFDFNAIVRDEPTYTIHTRPGRRSRRANPHADGAGPMRLPMDWTFTSFGEDDEVARYLVDSRAAEDSSAAPARRGYRMVWRSAPAQDDVATAGGDSAAPAGTSSLHKSVRSLSDFGYDSGDDYDDDFDDEMRDWAVLSPGAAARGDPMATATVDAATGTWVVLGDGS